MIAVNLDAPLREIRQSLIADLPGTTADSVKVIGQVITVGMDVLLERGHGEPSSVQSHPFGVGLKFMPPN
jgi:hypothetical protein